MRTPAPPPLRILLVEDDPADAELMLEALRREGIDVLMERVDQIEEVRRRLDETVWDVVISDYQLRGWRGTDVLAEVHTRALDVPVILVTGSLGEEFADICLREGAADFVLKHRLGRLPAAVRRVVELRDAQRDRTAALVRVRLLSVAVDQSPAAVFITDTMGQIQYVNRRFTEITGYAADEALGETPRILRSGKTPRDVYERMWRTILAGRPWRSEILNRRKNGELYWCQVSVSPMRDRDGVVQNFVAVHEDVSERRWAEHAIKEREERLRQIAENIREVFWIVAADFGETLYISPAYEEVWGRSCRSMYEDPSSFVQSVHEEDRPALIANVTRVRAGEDPGGIEFRVVHPGGEQRWVHAHAAPVLDERGQVYRISGVALDVTEKRALESQLRQSQKLEAVARLASGVAHDFNNLLTVIMTEVQLLRLADGAPEDLAGALEDIEMSAKRAAALTRQLLTFSRRDVVEAEVLDPGEVLDGLQKMLTRLIGEDIRLDSAVAPAVGKVHIDRGHLEQVIVNLVVNARDAMPDGGDLHVEVSNVELDGSYAEADPGPYVLISVSDTGTGMSEEVKARIFEPFFTTKPSGKGTGLGLATSYGIVTEVGGHLGVYSEVGVGTTMKVYLPRVADEAVVRADPATSAEAEAPISAMILVVEDDSAVRRSTERILRHLGCQVLATSSAAEALERLASLDRVPDLLFTDVVMPETSGPALAAQARERYPGLRVLYTTGYTSDMATRLELVESGVEVLMKPFTPKELAAKVRSVLAS